MIAEVSKASPFSRLSCFILRTPSPNKCLRRFISISENFVTRTLNWGGMFQTQLRFFVWISDFKWHTVHYVSSTLVHLIYLIPFPVLRLFHSFFFFASVSSVIWPLILSPIFFLHYYFFLSFLPLFFLLVLFSAYWLHQVTVEWRHVVHNGINVTLREIAFMKLTSLTAMTNW